MLNDAELTPMYRQWAQAKRDYPDVLILFRMGDFYEMFGEDAEVGARLLELTLTSRGVGGGRIPMCGVPHHAIGRYLPTNGWLALPTNGWLGLSFRPHRKLR